MKMGEFVKAKNIRQIDSVSLHHVATKAVIFAILLTAPIGQNHILPDLTRNHVVYAQKSGK